MQKGFAENVTTTGVAVVKSHRRKEILFQRVILLIRDPVNTFLAEFNRRMTGTHTGVAEESVFKNHWEQHVDHCIKRWFKLYSTWVNVLDPKNILLISYENLQHDTESEMKRVMDFLDLEFSPKDMKCMLERKTNELKRPENSMRKMVTINDQQRELLNSKRNTLFKKLRKLALINN